MKRLLILLGFHGKSHIAKMNNLDNALRTLGV